MLPIAGQTAGPIGLKNCRHSGVLQAKINRNNFFPKFFIHGQRRALQLV